jgi:hypothetical protein
MLLPAAAGPGSAPVELRLLVSKEIGPDSYQPLAAARPEEPGSLQHRQGVPPAPQRVRLRIGDRVRIQVRADRDGHVTVFNIGPTGNFHLLGPSVAGRLEADRLLDVLEVGVTPPAGRERVVAVWTREPLPLGDVLALTGGGPGVSAPYRATRDLERVQKSVRQLGRDDWHAVALDLDTEA